MEYRTAVHHAALILDLASKSKKFMRELFEPPDVSLWTAMVPPMPEKERKFAKRTLPPLGVLYFDEISAGNSTLRLAQLDPENDNHTTGSNIGIYLVPAYF